MNLAQVVAAKIDDKYYHFSHLEEVPANGSRTLILGEELPEFGVDRLTEILHSIDGDERTFEDRDAVFSAVIEKICGLPQWTVQPEVKKRKKYQRRSFCTFVFLKPEGLPLRELQKMTPQARRVFELATRGATEWPVVVEETAVQSLMRDNRGHIGTVQDPYRIFQYYRSMFIAHDLLRVR